MRKTVNLFLVSLCLLPLIGCGHGPDRDRNKAPTFMIYSPNGEPLNGGPLGHPTCEEAMKGWLDRLDMTRRGRIDKPLFFANAERVFQEIDTQQDKVLTAAELEKARFPFRQFASPRPERRNDDSKGSPHGPGRGGEGRDDIKQQDRANGIQPDPIMAADTNLDFKVTLEEYRAQTAKTFAALDHDNKGYLDLKDITPSCQ